MDRCYEKWGNGRGTKEKRRKGGEKKGWLIFLHIRGCECEGEGW